MVPTAEVDNDRGTIKRKSLHSCILLSDHKAYVKAKAKFHDVNIPTEGEDKAK
jgi:hypothetical protein